MSRFIYQSNIEQFGGFDEALLRHQDLQFLVDALKVANFYVLQEYLVKLHGDSEINKPNADKIVETKKAFFESVDDEFKKYCASDKKRIKNAHYYEIVLVAVRAKKWGVAIKYALKAGINPRSINDLMKRFKGR